jgi:hypothetical protein
VERLLPGGVVIKARIEDQRGWRFGPASFTRTRGVVQGHRSTTWALCLLLGWRALAYGAESAQRSVQLIYVVFHS